MEGRGKKGETYECIPHICICVCEGFGAFVYVVVYGEGVAFCWVEREGILVYWDMESKGEVLTESVVFPVCNLRAEGFLADFGVVPVVLGKTALATTSLCF